MVPTLAELCGWNGNGVSTAKTVRIWNRNFFPKQEWVAQGSRSVFPPFTQLCEYHIPGTVVHFYHEKGVVLKHM